MTFEEFREANIDEKKKYVKDNIDDYLDVFNEEHLNQAIEILELCYSQE